MRSCWRATPCLVTRCKNIPTCSFPVHNTLKTHTYFQQTHLFCDYFESQFSNHKPNPFISIKPPLAIQFCKQLSVRFTITQLSFVHASSTHKSHSYMRPTHTRVILTCFKHTSVFSSSNPNAIVNRECKGDTCDMTAACLTVALLWVRCGRSQTDAPATPRKTMINETKWKRQGRPTHEFKRRQINIITSTAELQRENAKCQMQGEKEREEDLL